MKVKKSLRKILNPNTSDRHMDGCGMDACQGCLPSAYADFPCLPNALGPVGHLECKSSTTYEFKIEILAPFVPHIVAPTPLASADCAPCFPLKKMKRQRRSVVAIIREKMAEKRLIIKEKSARSGSFLFDLF
jgi:hypothetical protein